MLAIASNLSTAFCICLILISAQAQKSAETLDYIDDCQLFCENNGTKRFRIVVAKSSDEHRDENQFVSIERRVYVVISFCSAPKAIVVDGCETAFQHIVTYIQIFATS
jgi:hypothetical protein